MSYTGQHSYNNDNTTPYSYNPSQLTPPPPQPRKRHRLRKALLGFTGLAVLFVIIASVASGNHSSNTAATSTPAPQVTVSAPVVQSNPATAPATPAATSAPATPALTESQQQAVSAAQQYLALGTGFSEAGLMEQLTSSDGSGFSQADAQFAIDYLKPNWDQQAVEAAKGYLQLGGFSASSLYQQLTSSYGSGFTPAQADYALQQVGMG